MPADTPTTATPNTPNTPEESNPEVARLIERAGKLETDREAAVKGLAAVRSLIQNYATIGEVAESDHAAIGRLFPRQFADYAKVAEAEDKAAADKAAADKAAADKK